MNLKEPQVAQSTMETFGFVEIDAIQSVQATKQLTSHLGRIRLLNGQNIQALTPRARGLAQSPSFSQNFGYGRFPLHTDTAFWEVPARYVVLYMPEASNVDTVVLPSSAIRELLLRYKRLNPIFVRKTVSGHRYSTPWFGPDSNFIVFDPCYMRPANKAALHFCETVEEYFDHSKKVTWTGSKMIVLDNWRTLHGRMSAQSDDRVLFRFYRG